MGMLLDVFKDKAGFSMPRKSLPMADLYEASSVAKCIMNWVDDKSPSRPPTWRSFLQILQEPEINLGDTADKIERLLVSTTENQQLQRDGEY